MSKRSPRRSTRRQASSDIPVSQPPDRSSASRDAAAHGPSASAAAAGTARPSTTAGPSTAAAVRIGPARRWTPWAIGVGMLAGIGIAGAWLLAWQPPPARWDVEVVRAYPHDPRAYTQGLVFDAGELVEGTGLYGESTLRRVALESGRVLQSVPLPKNLFGEGIAVWGGQIFQLTWRNQIALVYDRATLRELRRLRYSGEGWGLTHDGVNLILSDGSATLRFLDPKTFRVVRQIMVRSGGRRVANLNELEYVRGEILANIWYRDYVARIDPATGEVRGWIDLRNVIPAGLDREQCANGIAYDAEHDRLFVTGKNWPQLFEIRLVDPAGR